MYPFPSMLSARPLHPINAIIALSLLTTKSGNGSHRGRHPAVPPPSDEHGVSTVTGPFPLKYFANSTVL
jgi:hypothetical protein